MAQNIIKKYEDESDFYKNVRNPLEQFYNIDFKLQKLSMFLNSAEATDYPNAPITELGQLRTALNTYFASTDYLALKSKVEDFIRI